VAIRPPAPPPAPKVVPLVLPPPPPPPATTNISSVKLAVLVSDTVTVVAVATTGPLVLPVLTSIIIVSDPSVVKSSESVKTIVPILLVIVKEPELAALVKSPALVVPLLVQYSVVPLGIFFVVIV
jgi:hypothetical protein